MATWVRLEITEYRARVLLERKAKAKNAQKVIKIKLIKKKKTF